MSGPLIQLQQRRDLAAIWTSVDPVLPEGQIGYETDTGWHKIGDGVTAWTSLAYYHGPPWWAGLDGWKPDSTYLGAPVPADEFGVMAYVDRGIEPPIELTGVSDTHWSRIDAVGRHATDTDKLVFAGIPGTNGGGGSDLSIGILDRNDGSIVLLDDAFSTATARGSFNVCGGIDCDPATGIYVAHQSNQGTNNEYPLYYSTDLVTWTQCTETGWNTRFHGGGDVIYDIDQGLWYLMDSIAVYTSDDGIEWFEQDQDYFSFGAGRCTQSVGCIQAGFVDGALDLTFMGGNTEYLVTIQNGVLDPAPIFYERWHGGQDPINLIISSQNPAMHAGVATNGSDIVMMAKNGIVIYSESLGALNTWKAGAAPSGNTPDDPGENEFLNGTYSLTIGAGVLNYIEGDWWVANGGGGTNGWYRYTGTLPITTGWVQDNTGPHLERNIQTQLHRDPNGCRMAYAGYTTSGFQQWVWFDEGDL